MSERQYQGVIPITPNDVTDVHFVGFMVSVSGNVKVTDWLGNTNTIPVFAGTWVPLEITRIWATDTTATGIYGLA